jgi:hypothetical protein
METIGENYSIDVALLNISGHYGWEAKNGGEGRASDTITASHSEALWNLPRNRPRR